MPADLSMNAKGEAEMAYQSREVPWHGLGQPIKAGVTTDEMLVAARLDWEVKLAKPDFVHDGVGRKTDEQHRIMYRGDTGAVLDFTGPKYVPFQNSEVMNFFREYAEAGEMELETAGALNGGKQIWAQAKMNAGFTLPGKDRVEGYILFMNPHQYGKGGLIKFTPTRVVCSNTMAMAITGGGDSLKLWHNRAFDNEMAEDAKRKLGIARERLESFKVTAQDLASWIIDENLVLKALAEPFKAEPEKALEEQSPTVQRLVELWDGKAIGADLKAANKTAWGLLNAVTQYYDWEYGKTVDSRMTNAWLGTGSVKKRQVLTELVTLGQGR
jgi:phage/plasmid-like protein (TIGR03299 family)